MKRSALASCLLLLAVHAAAVPVTGKLGAWSPKFPLAPSGQVASFAAFVAKPGMLTRLGLPPALKPDGKVLGALSVSLPGDFFARLETALASPEAWSAQADALTAEVKLAMGRTSQSLDAQVESRARRITQAILQRKITQEEAYQAAAELQPWRFFGGRSATLAWDVLQLARSSYVIEMAKGIAQQLLRDHAAYLVEAYLATGHAVDVPDDVKPILDELAQFQVETQRLRREEDGARLWANPYQGWPYSAVLEKSPGWQLRRREALYGLDRARFDHDDARRRLGRKSGEAVERIALLLAKP